jgi:hypothetical protein
MLADGLRSGWARRLLFCRECRDLGGYISKLDAEKKCPRCGAKYNSKKPAKYIGKLMHDFRRSTAYESWKAGSTIEDCMKVTGHKTTSMFKRYADLFSEEEKRASQRQVQQKRREWRQSQVENVVILPKAPAVQ